MKELWVSRFIVVACLAALTGCAGGPRGLGVENPPSVEIGVLMDNAAISEKAGQKDVALRQYDEASKLYPTSILPWLRVAQIKFESANYGEAITSAQQVISRDERNTIAHSILAVSGLRVSTKALADLRRQNELTGSVRNEAQDLAKVLRESLGERILVPAVPATATRPVPKSQRSRRAPKASGAEAKTQPSDAKGSGSPFGALK